MSYIYHLTGDELQALLLKAIEAYKAHKDEIDQSVEQFMADWRMEYEALPILDNVPHDFDSRLENSLPYLEEDWITEAQIEFEAQNFTYPTCPDCGGDNIQVDLCLDCGFVLYRDDNVSQAAIGLSPVA